MQCWFIEEAVVLAGLDGDSKHADDGRVGGEGKRHAVLIQKGMQLGTGFGQQFESHRCPWGWGQWVRLP